MSRREYIPIGGGFLLSPNPADPYMTVIKKSGRFTWFGGAAWSDPTVPLHGPFWTKRKAKRVAERQLALLQGESE